MRKCSGRKETHTEEIAQFGDCDDRGMHHISNMKRGPDRSNMLFEIASVEREWREQKQEGLR
jgi:hypothetical protein